MAESMGQIPFGKHRGKDIEDVPTDYLKWFIGEKNIRENNFVLCEQIKKELKYRENFGGPE